MATRSAAATRPATGAIPAAGLSQIPRPVPDKARAPAAQLATALGSAPAAAMGTGTDMCLAWVRRRRRSTPSRKRSWPTPSASRCWWVLDALSPAERIAFVLHDLFGFPFDDIASIVQRTPEATRQLASRARRRVRREPNVTGAELTAHRDLVTRFLAALRAGDVETLVSVLDPDVVVRVDGAAAASGRPVEVHGARTWATTAVTFAARMLQAEIALVDGSVGVVFAPGGRLSRVLSITIENGRVKTVDVIADPARLDHVEVSAFAE